MKGTEAFKKPIKLYNLVFSLNTEILPPLNFTAKKRNIEPTKFYQTIGIPVKDAGTELEYYKIFLGLRCNSNPQTLWGLR